MDSLTREIRRVCISSSPRPLCTPPLAARRLFSASSSSASSASSTTASPSAQAPTQANYPFATTTLPLPAAPSTTASPSPPPRRDSLLRTLNAHLTSQHPHAEHYSQLFSRRDKRRLLPGSVLTVTSYASAPSASNPSPPTTVFSGVLIALRRRHQGRDTSIRLRNLVGRTGVEQSFKVLSPLIRDIRVVARAETSGPAVVAKDGREGPRRKAPLPAARRAKMYFVRDQPNRLVSVAGIVRAAREREATLAARKGRR
ncbi:putative 50s ribosomal protein l19 [Rhodotorula diobovata]|uniref:Putative 50s ribosomal protein l19 n=1 Tax=Rhodotorula diobovata TaxID=5288 RepID=A0A5C5G8I4_9BASI|nr:putative 50s ribosomal protein l19 [Rhodotorula diobovata]